VINLIPIDLSDRKFDSSHNQGSCRNPSDELDKDFLEMYEIHDEDLIVKKTIKILANE